MKKNALIIASLLCVSALSLAACDTKTINTPTSENTTDSSMTSAADLKGTETSPTVDIPATEVGTESTAVSDGVIKVANTYELKPDTPLNAGSDKFTYYEEYSDEYENDGKAFIKYNDQIFDLGDTQWIADSYVAAMSDGSYYIFATFQYDNDYRATKLAQISGNKYTESEIVDGAVLSADSITDDTVIMESRIDAFGTYGVTNEYTYREGSIKPCDMVYDIENEVRDADGKWFESIDADDWLLMIYDEYGKNILTVKTSFDATGNDNESISIPMDAKIYPTRIDIENRIFYFEYNGDLCSFKYEGDASYNRNINGILEEDLFYVLPYAG